jgi:hydroxymethylbilane synthase
VDQVMRIGTRASALALAQARWVADALGGGCEVVPISTAGDRGQELGDKSRWVTELERALLDGEIELAVHSAKDVPAELADGLSLVAIPPREDPRDALCGAASIAALPQGARVGTSSLRRTAQLRAAREDLTVVPVRGNVDTRLRKLAGGQLDALVLALAGLRRLQRDADATAVLDEFVPAAGQGALAVEARAEVAGDERLQRLNDPEASACVLTERELTRTLGASCHSAVGAHASRLRNGLIELRGWVGRADGSAWVSDCRIGRGPEVGREVAEAMLSAGADELLLAGAAGDAETAVDLPSAANNG